MLAKKENIQKIDYRIKLLSGNNVVLVEADNYEAEIFTPQIVNGRITFLNIIPNRRCCQVTKTNVMNFAMKEPLASAKYLREQNIEKPKKLGRISAGQYFPLIVPLANSTPAAIKRPATCSSMATASFSNSNNPYASNTDCSLPTPEPARRAAPVRRSLLEKSMLNLPPGVRVARIYHNSMEGTPKKVGRLVTTNQNSGTKQNAANVSLLSSSFRLPCSPSLSKQTSRGRSVINNCPTTAVDSVAKWQKVLTPVRTYTRNSKKPVMLPRPTNIQSAKKTKKSNKVIPTYLVNPTKGLDVSQHIEVKKRKLIIDKKLCISPKTFKRQQQEPPESLQTKSTIIQPASLSFHKPRAYMDTLAMSAFDLLTNASRQRCMSDKLKQQFRKGCVNKASSTYSKYKVLCTIPPMQQDEQVLELSRITMPSPKKSRHIFNNVF